MVREDPEWVGQAVRARCLYSVAGMDAVEVRRDLTCLARDGDTLRFDLYGPGRERGVILLIHGGPIPGNLLTPPSEWGLFQSLARMVAASGVAAIMFNHRFFGFDQAETAMNDIEDLMRHIEQNGSGLGVDGSRICLWVFSGGGSLLSRVLHDTPDSVKCIVAYYANLQARDLPETAGGIPPMLVARAGLDAPGLNELIDHFIASALKLNASIEVLNHATGQHGFDFRDNNDRTREILARTVEFAGKHLYFSPRAR